MIRAPDAASIATIHWLETVIGRKCGGSTGTNVYAALILAEEMIAEGRAGSIVTLICDLANAISTPTTMRTGSREKASTHGLIVIGSRASAPERRLSSSPT